MTAFQHNKLLGILHLAFAGFSVLLLVAMGIFMAAMFGLILASEPGGEDVPAALVGIVIFFVIFVNVLLVAPSFVAGYALLKRRSWAKIAGLVAGILASLSFPHGSALCVYTLWFLFGENGKSLYEKHDYVLPPAPPMWARAPVKERETEFIPPSTPPDWR